MIAGLIVASYLIGSIPVAWLLTRLTTGQDLREMGSGNVGVMNTAISVSRWAGFIVLITEATKGIASVLLAYSLGGNDELAGLALLSAVTGTRWPIWLRGDGGRGNTTGVAGLLLISWIIVVIILITWIIARLFTHDSFLATRIGLLTWPLTFGVAMQSWWFVLLGIAFSAVYLQAQRRETDDHKLLKGRGKNLLAFFISPPRKGSASQEGSPPREDSPPRKGDDSH
jgi:glycerol-3-phosphate acyltransferase PlsY